MQIFKCLSLKMCSIMWDDRDRIRINALGEFCHGLWDVPAPSCKNSSMPAILATVLAGQGPTGKRFAVLPPTAFVRAFDAFHIVCFGFACGTQNNSSSRAQITTQRRYFPTRQFGSEVKELSSSSGVRSPSLPFFVATRHSEFVYAEKQRCDQQQQGSQLDHGKNPKNGNHTNASG